MRWHGAKKAERSKAVRYLLVLRQCERDPYSRVDLIVSEAGDGVLIFTGPDGKSPQLDKFEISFASAPQPEPADKTQLNEAIASADALDAADYTSTSWAALQEALNSAKRVAGG